MMRDMGYSLIYTMNPFFYLIQIMRDSLMGQPANPKYWLVAACILSLIHIFMGSCSG